mmetsp:Transcript_39650/g.92790  ORF Transcript_39650/g.92790 Transcript_39650/m.92790 type:complete len:1186 (-) Transcript_39650:188-3745(-)
MCNAEGVAFSHQHRTSRAFIARVRPKSWAPAQRRQGAARAAPGSGGVGREIGPVVTCQQALIRPPLFRETGLFVARRTWPVFIGSVLFALILIGGVSRLTSETETENLWTPRGAQVKTDKATYDANFGTGFRGESIYFKPKDGTNILTRDHFLEVLEFDTKFRRELTVEVEGTVYNFASICAKARPADAFCLAGGSPLEFIYNIETHRFDASFISDTNQLLSTINRASIDFTPDGSRETFSLDISNRHDLMANKRFDGAGQITEASTLRMSWFASRVNDTVRDEDCEGKDSEGNEMTRISCNPTVVWEDEFEKRVNEEFNKNSKFVFAHVQTASSIGNELSKVIGGDVISLNVGLFLIVLYAILVLGKFHPVLSRSALAFSGVASVGLAIGGTFGLGGWTGVPQTPVTSTLPFILLGIGVDDMFVLAGALGRAPMHLSAEERIGYMMKTAGTSILITTLTDMLAFALSTTTSFPALSYFCTWASFGILLDFIFQITFFVCACVWDEQRVAIPARDCFCCGCCCAKKGGCCDFCFVDEEQMQKKGCGVPCCCLTCQKDGGYLRGVLKDYYAPMLIKTPVKVIVIVVFFGILGLGAYGSTQLNENFSLRFFVPSDSPLNTVFDIQDEEFRTGSTSVSVLLDHSKDGGYLHQPSMRTDSAKIAQKMEMFPYFEAGSLVDPLRNFTTYIFETADAFPLSPHFFWVPEYAGRDWLARTSTVGTVTVYPSLRADDLTLPPPASTVVQGGISSGEWARLRTATYMEGIPADGSFSRDAYIKNTKLFYDVLAHFMTTPQGAGMRSYFAPQAWYEGFTDWIESLPEEEFIDGTFRLDKRRDLARGMLNDVHNGTARPKHPEKFCAALKYFLNSDAGKGFKIEPPLGDEADCYPASGDYNMSRIGVDMRCRVDDGACPLSNSTAEVEIMQGSRDAVKGTSADLNPRAYSFSWLFAEQYAVVRNEALWSILQAIIAVGVVTIIFISHWWTGLIVVGNIAMVLFDIIGIMWLWDISINSISIVYLVLAIGLAVDYSAHIAHAFMSATGTHNERVVTAITEMGADVAHGAMSTFLAVVVMSASKSYIFILFFRQFFAICLFGFCHGMIFLPVVLSLIGPGSSSDEDPSEKQLEAVAGDKAVVEHAQPSTISQAPGPVNAMGAIQGLQAEGNTFGDAPNLSVATPIAAVAADGRPEYPV